jgi:hypothetical protein
MSVAIYIDKMMELYHYSIKPQLCISKFALFIIVAWIFWMQYCFYYTRYDNSSHFNNKS